ncbi:MAG: DMT family transporter [Rhodospirillales bacterium]|nr:DMT family transporter [Rhodospirillales bacterium]
MPETPDLPEPTPSRTPLFRALPAAWAKLPANVRGAVFVTLGGFLLILMASLVKHLGKSLPAFEVLFVRFLAGLIVILPLVWRMGIKIVHTRKIYLHATRGFVGFIGNMLFFFALIHISLADTVTIQFSRPLFMIVIATLFFGEVVGLKRGIATLVGFGGILMITKPFGEGFDPWALSALGGAFFGSMVVLTVKLLSRTEQTVTIMFYFGLFTTMYTFIPAMLTWQTPTWIELALLILTGTLGIIGQGLFTHGVGLGEISFVIPFDYLRIVYSFLLGIIWFTEVPGFWSFSGAAVIIGSSVYLLRTENRKKAEGI